MSVLHDDVEDGEDGRLQGMRSLSRSTRRLLEAVFDASFYFRNYPDAQKAGVDALDHYLELGWREGRNPSATFSTNDYLEQNPHLRPAGICPLVHYVRVGVVEGRPWRGDTQAETQPSLRAARNAIASALPLAERVKPWGLPCAAPTLEGPLSEVIAAFAPERSVGIVVALSHDDYATVAGGVQNCIAEEARAFAEKGWVYLHICPTQPLPVLAEPAAAIEASVWARLNGKRLGAVTMHALAQALQHASFGNGPRLLVLHHLMGFAPELVAHIAQALAPEETIAWVHDFFTLCPSYALLRNNVAFCGGPPPESQACGICAYGGNERKRHLARVKRLFAHLQPTVLAPSDTALKFWMQRSQLSCGSARTVAVGTLAMDSLLPGFRGRPEHHLRVGFLGFPLYQKGWHTFERLADSRADDPRYSFFHLGSARAADYRNISFVEVVMDRERQDFMVDAVAANRIGVIINWSLCYETFSFTTHEAIAGGAFVLALQGAGNIVPAILRAEQGLGLDSEQELFDLFASGEVLEIAKRRRRGTFTRHPGTAYYLETVRP